MRVHEVKAETSFYLALAEGKKTAEIRYNDRQYEVNDYLVVSSCYKGGYSGIQGHTTFQITHVLHHGDFPDGIQCGYCMLSLRRVPLEEELVMWEMNKRLVVE